MVAFLTVHKMTKRQPAKKATGAFMAVANRHIYPHFTRLMFIYSSGVITEDKVDQHPSKQEGGGEGDFDAECKFSKNVQFLILYSKSRFAGNL